MLIVKEVQLKPGNYQLPAWFIQLFPSKCPICGSNMLLSEDLSKYVCSSRTCRMNTSYYLWNVLKGIGVARVTIEEADRIIETHHLENPYKIFDIDLRKPMYKGITRRRQKEITDKISDHYHITAKEYYRLTGMLSQRSLDKLDNREYKSMEEVLEASLTQKSYEIPIEAIKDYYTYQEHKDMYETGMQYIDIIDR